MSRLILPVLSAALLAACGGASDAPQDTADTPAPAPAQQAAETVPHQAETPAPAETAAAVEEAPTDEHAITVLASLGAEYAEADLTAGARVFRRCQACHTLTEGGRHTVGPNLYGMFNQPAAQAEGFSYSRQLTEAGLVWDVATLDSWIENPRAMVPGNRMSFVGLRNPDQRRDVIAYMAVETSR